MDLRNNPYQSPSTGIDFDVKVSQNPTLESEVMRLLLLVLGAFGGGLLGNMLGTFVAKLIGAVPGPVLQIVDIFAIRHALGLGLLVIGCFFGAWIGIRIGALRRR